jgi:hypothetical protein
MNICSQTGINHLSTTVIVRIISWLVSMAFRPQASYTDRVRGRPWSVKLVPTFAGRGVSHGQYNGSSRSLISAFSTGAATFHSGSSSIIRTRLSGPRSRPTGESNPGPLDLQPGTLPTRPQRQMLLLQSHILSTPKSRLWIEEWCLVGCYAVWLL